MTSRTDPTLRSKPAWVKRVAHACEVVCVADRLAPNWDEARWHAARLKLITASEVPIVLGIKPGKPRLWYEKRGMIDRDTRLDTEEYAQMGHALEATNAEIFANKTGRKVQRAQVLLRSKAYPWLGTTLDYTQWLAGDSYPAPLELKSTGRQANWPDDGEPALHYQAQLQTQMIVLGSSWGSLAAVIGSPYFHHRHLDYERHAALCQLVIEQTERFWHSVQTGVCPPVDDDPDTNWVLRHLALDALADQTTPLPTAAIEWVEKWDEAKAAIAGWERTKSYYESLILTAMGTHDTGILPYESGTLTAKVQHRAAYSVAETAFRVLRRSR